MVLALVLRQHGGSVALVAQAPVVDELDAALPVAVEDVAGRRTVHVVLPSHEIPHEIAPVHPSQLEIEEVRQVRAHRGLGVLGALYAGAFAAGVCLVELLGVVVDVVPHAGEEHLSGRVVLCLAGAFHLLVLAVHRGPVFGLGDLEGRIVILAVDEGGAAVLLAREVADQREGVVRLVLVGGGLRAGADDIYAEDGESYDDGGEAEEGGVPEDLLAVYGAEDAPEAECQHCHHEEGRAAVVGQAEDVDEEEVGVGGEFGQPGDDAEQDYREDDDADEEDLAEFLEGEGAVFAPAVVEHEHQGGDGQEVEQMDSYAEAHQEGDEHYPARGVGLVGLVVPFGHHPEDDGGDERAHRVDFAFDCGEPEGVREAVSEGAHEAGGDYGDGFACGKAVSFAGGD